MAKRKLRNHHYHRQNDQPQPQSQATGANSQPVTSKLHRRESTVVCYGNDNFPSCGALSQTENLLAVPQTQESSPRVYPLVIPPPPRLEPFEDPTVPFDCGIPPQTLRQKNHAPAVTEAIEAKKSSGQSMMNANGTHPSHRHQQPQQPQQPQQQPHPQVQRDRRHHVDESTGTNPPNGPMPSHIQVAKPYVFHQAIEACLADLGVLQAGEDRIRLAGVQWIDNVRKALKLPVRTFDTAVVYYHKFRLSHADNEYSFVDAAAAALFAACKIEDTLKKSRDILCAAHNLKLSSRADHLSPDDPTFEAHSRNIIGLERLMLEASSFDFRNRHPQPLMVKMEKHYGLEKHSAVTKTAHLISLDLYRTFAPLKQSTATMAFACLELSGRLHGKENEKGMRDICEGRDYKRWGIERDTVMETLLDVLELYTLHRPQTVVAPLFNQDIFLDIRIPLNEELSKKRMSRYTEFVHTSQLKKKADPANYAAASTNGVAPTGTPNGPLNGRIKASPTSPATPSTPGLRQRAGERGKEGTIRFMLNPDREREEKEIVASYAPLMAAVAAKR